ncbi:MAG: NUDIX hydrolase [Streptosporangiaceae bacterium]
MPCVGAVITDAAQRLLLIQRGHEPGMGLWSLPGGRVEPAETDEQAVIREIREECGLEVSCGALLGAVERPGLAGTVVLIRDYRAEITGGRLRPGDDAADARWVDRQQFADLDADGQLTAGLSAALRSWSALPWPAQAPPRAGTAGH